MKLLIDTNVIISGITARGYSFDVIKDAIDKHAVYYTSYLLEEIQRTLSTKFSLSKDVIHFSIFIIKRDLIKGKTASKVENVCRDPDDNQILADALANEIEVIITGDGDLLDLKSYKGIKIISPREYWKL
ncbi:MAG: putative toxin-antitoxin system toxin component, PIN family [bacterium]